MNYKLILNQDTLLIIPPSGAPVILERKTSLANSIELTMELMGENSKNFNEFLEKACSRQISELEQKFKEINTDNRIQMLTVEEVSETQPILVQQVVTPESPKLNLKIDGETLPEFLEHKTTQMVNEGLNVDAIVKFWDKLKENPNENSRKCLFNYLESNKFTLTEDGDFIAYKKVTKVGNDLKDSHSKTVINNVGSIPTMERSKVNSNPNEHCSHGLHVGAWEYVNNFTGDVTIICKVNPRDVCAVPTDYRFQKMRTCRYEVLAITNKPYDNGLQLVKTNNVKEEIQLTDVKPKTIIDNSKTKVEENKFNNFDGMTAKQIIDFVKEKTGQEITISLKNKASIIKLANKIING